MERHWAPWESDYCHWLLLKASTKGHTVKRKVSTNVYILISSIKFLTDQQKETTNFAKTPATDFEMLYVALKTCTILNICFQSSVFVWSCSISSHKKNQHAETCCLLLPSSAQSKQAGTAWPPAAPLQRVSMRAGGVCIQRDTRRRSFLSNEIRFWVVIRTLPLWPPSKAATVKWGERYSNCIW